MLLFQLRYTNKTIWLALHLNTHLLPPIWLGHVSRKVLLNQNLNLRCDIDLHSDRFEPAVLCREIDCADRYTTQPLLSVLSNNMLFGKRLLVAYRWLFRSALHR